VITLDSGMSIREGSGFHLWTESGERIYQGLLNKKISQQEIYRWFPKEQIQKEVIKTATEIKQHDNSGRSLEDIFRTTWVGECAELATIVAFINAEIHWTHTARLTKRSAFDIMALDKAIEVKSFPYNSIRRNDITFASDRTMKNVSQKWNSFDLYIPVLWTDTSSLDAFSDGLEFTFWKIIDSKVFWSNLSMFCNRVLDQDRAFSEQLIRNLS
jgi:hypothetical protein